MNFANKLTVLRIFLIPIIVIVFLFPYAQFNIELFSFTLGHVEVPGSNLITLLLFCIASFTDYLDGKIARSRNLVTTFGKFADPMADKLLVNLMLIMLAYKHMIPVVPALIMVARDTIVDGCRMIASQNGVVIAAAFVGKLKTFTQMFAIIFVLLCNLPFELYGIPVAEILIWFAALVSIAGGYHYFAQVKEFVFESM